MKDFQRNLKAHIDLALSRRHDWSEVDFIEGVMAPLEFCNSSAATNAVRSVSRDPFHLWAILEKAPKGTAPKGTPKGAAKPAANNAAENAEGQRLEIYPARKSINCQFRYLRDAAATPRP
jgi:hypothetical protein